MRLMLFTDTLGDTNGVSRFIQNIGHESLRSGRDMLVATSTRFEVPPEACFFNPPPAWAMRMPRYPQLDLVRPPKRAMLARADEFAPDVVHVSTPGPVGLLGRRYALRRGLPLAGVYHTDFPAYVETLAGGRAARGLAARFMAWFYRPFGLILSRSEEYMRSLEALGLECRVMEKLAPGIALEDFDASLRDPSTWDAHGLPPGSVRVLYVGRISKEKNLPMLVDAWPAIRERAERGGVDARLVVVGLGPYAGEMEDELAPHGAVFLGEKRGRELATLYASADLFVFPSRTDTLGQVVLESQSAGIPVVVGDEGGPKEVVDDGRTGLVLPAGDPGAWIEAIARLCIDHDRRRAMGAAATPWSQQFSIAASFDRFWASHEGLLRPAVASAASSAAG
ncbi:MAG: glycosyltransferase family 1 protein [Planctomycetota bacterium]